MLGFFITDENKMRRYARYARSLRVKIRQSMGSVIMMILMAAACIMPLVNYLASPYWASQTLLHDLQHNDVAVIQTQIPHSIIHQIYPATFPNLYQWHGAGKRYLAQVWPIVAAKQNPYHIMQLAATSPQHIHRAYSHFPNDYVMQLDSFVVFKWHRHGFASWELTDVCVYNPQPADDLNRCPSSNR